MERVEGANQLRELSLIPEEDRTSWASLPQVAAGNHSGMKLKVYCYN